MNIAITSSVRNFRRVDQRTLVQCAAHAARCEGFREGELSIAVVGARAMARLHEHYMSDPTATDVLTFDLGGDRRNRLLQGEIVVCAAVARARAAPDARAGNARGWVRELCLYVVHGVLHLAGYEDHSRAGYAAMHRREDQLLRQLGIGPVFAGRTTQPGNLRKR